MLYPPPLACWSKKYGLSHHQHVDGTQLSANGESNALCPDILSEALEEVNNWLLQSRLKLNPSKMEVQLVAVARSTSCYFRMVMQLVPYSSTNDLATVTMQNAASGQYMWCVAWLHLGLNYFVYKHIYLNISEIWDLPCRQVGTKKMNEEFRVYLQSKNNCTPHGSGLHKYSSLSPLKSEE